jgi:hypothetical protein
MSLNGITRRRKGIKQDANPIPHRGLALQNRVIMDVRGPNGKVKKHVEAEGNYMVDFGLSRVAINLSTLAGAGSTFAGGICVGTSTTAATNSQTALVASLTGAGAITPTVSGVTASYAGTIASGATGSVQEIGLFTASNMLSASMIARLVLTGTQSVILGVSDTINATYQVICKTA